MIKGAHLFGGPQEMHPFEILREKMEFRDLGAEGCIAVLLSAMLGNIIGGAGLVALFFWCT